MSMFKLLRLLISIRLFECLKQFGELPGEVADRLKYSVYRAGHIMTKLAAGEEPDAPPSASAEEDELNQLAAADPSGSTPAPFSFVAATPQPYNADISTGLKFPSVPTSTQPQFPSVPSNQIGLNFPSVPSTSLPGVGHAVSPSTPSATFPSVPSGGGHGGASWLDMPSVPQGGVGVGGGGGPLDFPSVPKNAFTPSALDFPSVPGTSSSLQQQQHQQPPPPQLQQPQPPPPQQQKQQRPPPPQQQQPHPSQQGSDILNFPEVPPPPSYAAVHSSGPPNNKIDSSTTPTTNAAPINKPTTTAPKQKPIPVDDSSSSDDDGNDDCVGGKESLVAPTIRFAAQPIGFRPSLKQMDEAQQLSKVAYSALNFEDVHSAVENLCKSLRALTGIEYSISSPPAKATRK
jgi:hypothetical protein